MPLILRSLGHLLLLLSLPAIALAGATAQEIQRTRALANPVLAHGASDRALVAHLRALHNQNADIDPSALVQIVLRDSYLESMRNLGHYAEKIKQFNKMKKALRDYLHELRNTSAELGAASRSPAIGGDRRVANALGRTQAALQRFEAALRRSRSIGAEDRRALKAMIAHDRRLLNASRRLITQARAIARSPHRTSHRPPTPPRQPPVYRRAPAEGNLRITPR